MYTLLRALPESVYAHHRAAFVPASRLPWLSCGGGRTITKVAQGDVLLKSAEAARFTFYQDRGVLDAADQLPNSNIWMKPSRICRRTHSACLRELKRT